MPFKSDRQRKAVMAKLSTSKGKAMPRIIKDTDGDGVPDHKDCEPYNPKKQGFLHDWQVRRLKSQEEKLEKIRQKELNKLNDTKEIIKQKLAVTQKKENIKQAELARKQAVIDEINREKAQIADLKQKNKVAKQKIFNQSPTGKVFKYSKGAIDATNKFFKKKSTQKILKSILEPK